jgi:hypothetical protein
MGLTEFNGAGEGIVLACSRGAHPTGPPSEATTQPSQGLIANLLLGLNGTLLPQSGAALATGLPSATSPYLFQEVWFKSLGNKGLFLDLPQGVCIGP